MIDDNKAKLIEKALEDIDIHFVEVFAFIYYLITLEEKEYYNPKIKYSKSYFAKYYGVDIKTLNKWIELFIPEFSNQKKLLIKENEYNIIISKIGRCDFINMKPYTLLEIANEVFSSNEIDKNWNKSMKYKEIKPIIKMHFKDLKGIEKLSKFPPRIANEIFINEIGKDLTEFIRASQTIFDKDFKFYLILKKIKELKNRTFQEKIKEENRLKKIGREWLGDSLKNRQKWLIEYNKSPERHKMEYVDYIELKGYV